MTDTKTEQKDTPQEELSATELADFDDVAAGQEETAAAMAQAKDDKPPADEQATAAVDDEPASAADDGAGDSSDEKGKQPTIPKSRFDEAIAKERERADARAAELQAQIDALKAGPPVNYGEEIASVTEAIKELRADWNNDRFDGSFDEYEAKQAELQDKKESLLVGKVKAAARDELIEEQRQNEEKRELQVWADAAAAFVAEHPIYKQDAPEFDADKKAELEAELLSVFARFPNMSHAEKLAEAHKRVVPSDPAPAGNVTNLHAARNAADAKAQAAASTAPNPAGAGAGDRGRARFPGIGPGMSEEDYKKLPKDIRESKDVAGF